MSLVIHDRSRADRPIRDPAGNVKQPLPSKSQLMGHNEVGAELGKVLGSELGTKLGESLGKMLGIKDGPSEGMVLGDTLGMVLSEELPFLTFSFGAFVVLLNFFFFFLGPDFFIFGPGRLNCRSCCSSSPSTNSIGDSRVLEPEPLSLFAIPRKQ